MLAHRLASLHDAKDQKVYSSVIVITDRRVLDTQLQTPSTSSATSKAWLKKLTKTARSWQRLGQGQADHIRPCRSTWVLDKVRAGR